MKRIAISILALGLAAATGAACAQSAYDGYGDADGDAYAQPQDARYGNAPGAHYDTARVVRVDPVIESGYQSYGRGDSGRNCYSRQDDGYATDDGYRNGDYEDGELPSNVYQNDSYRDDGYARNDGRGYDRGYGTSGGTRAGSALSTALGGIVGAVVGSHIGGGSGRFATTAVGTVIGGLAGQQIYANNNRYASVNHGTVTVCDPVSGDYGRDGDDAQVSGYDVTYDYAGRRYTTRTNYNPGNTMRVRVDVQPE